MKFKKFDNDLSELEWRQFNFTSYVNIIDYYIGLSKSNKKMFREKVSFENPGISEKTIRNNLARLIRAKNNGLDLSNFSSFKSIDNLNYALENDMAILNEEIKYEKPHIEIIKSDPKFIDFLGYTKSKKYDLNSVILALKEL